jgi:hypothetical protein
MTIDYNFRQGISQDQRLLTPTLFLNFLLRKKDLSD